MKVENITQDVSAAVLCFHAVFPDIAMTALSWQRCHGGRVGN
jgi:hypothetical protein